MVQANIKRIVVVAESMYGPKFWSQLLEEAQAAYNSRAFLICLHKSLLEGFSKEFKYSESACLSTEREVYSTGELDDHKIKYLKNVERNFNILVNDIIQSDRHLGRGWFNGGSQHARSALANISNYEQTLVLIYNYLVKMTDILESWRPKVILMSGIASLETKCLCIAARMSGVPVRVLFPARLEDRYFWAEDEFLRSSLITKKGHESSEKIDWEEEEASAQPRKDKDLGQYEAFKKEKVNFQNKVSLNGFIVSFFQRFKEELKHLIYLKVKREKRSIFRYFLWEQIKHDWRIYRQHNNYEKLVKRQRIVKKLDGYVYFALHVEPESSIMVLSPEFNHQLATIDMISKSLPVGVSLLVKEHLLAFGRRPEHFYKEIVAKPNVELASSHADSIELIKGSLAVATITGTVGYEAVKHGIPVMSFGKHNLYNTITFVKVIQSSEDLRNYLKELILLNREDLLKRNQLEGELFYEKIRKFSIAIDESKVRRKEGGFSKNEITKILDLLKISLT